MWNIFLNVPDFEYSIEINLSFKQSACKIQIKNNKKKKSNQNTKKQPIFTNYGKG